MKTNIRLLLYLVHLLERKMLQTKVAEKTKTHFRLNNFIFFENLSFYEIMCKNVVQPDSPQMRIRRMRIACCIPQPTNTHSEYVTLTAFPVQVARKRPNITLHAHCLYY